MCDQHTDARKVLVAELSPQALVEATDAVIGVGGALAIRNAVEEVAVVGALLPHPLHFGRAWLEVAKVLLSQARLLEDGDLVAREGRRGRIVRGQSAQDAFCGLAGAAVRRCIELQRVVRPEQRA